MIRYFIKKKRLKKNIYKIFKFYNNLKFFFQINEEAFKKLYFNINYLTLPKRQHFFSFLNINTGKGVILSSGVILNTLGYGGKFYKRSYISTASIILFFRKNFLNFFKYIYMYIIKNFNYRQFSFFKRLLTLIPVHIYYLVYRKSYTAQYFPKRRIKRRVLRLLGSK